MLICLDAYRENQLHLLSCKRAGGALRDLERLYMEQRGRCYYCGQPMVMRKKRFYGMQCTVDHKVPKSRGGEGGENKVAACQRCNEAKGMLTDVEFQTTIYGAYALRLKQLTELARELHEKFATKGKAAG